jgi:TolB-like protein/Flp pilus assembly protein TadD
MSSIIEGYNYDIFISYRQNDNKYDGWVTEFVDNLNKELEANIKDKISVYFDINPIDGLLETHSVDRSLEEKLKCLIFVPIISRTYCDPKSFAWQHEFCAFNKLAKEDRFGRDIRLASGNVASRILPIKIHDLDPEDKALLENELGGVMRCIEFIYKSAGVNRPLRANEDHPQDNLNKTYYRDQINKVANAVKEIIYRLKNFGKSISLIPTIESNIIETTSNRSFNSIAVLPFQDMSPQRDQEYFCDGITEEIINTLTHVGNLKVIARTSCFVFKGKYEDIREIGRKLDVETLLEGSVRKAGNKLRITAQLIQVADGSHLWSERYDRDLEDIFAVQDEISLAIVDNLKIKLLGDEKTAIMKHHTDNLEAYNLYLKGRYYWNKRTKDDLRKSINYFEESINIDIAFALAYAGLADSYIVLGEWWYYPPNEVFPKAKKAAMKAVELDYELAEAHNAMGAIKRDYEWDWFAAEKEYLKAIELNPNYPTAYQWYSEYLSIMGRHDEAIENIIHAQELNPLSPILYTLGGYLIYHNAKQYDQAISQCQKALEIDSNYIFAYNALARNYIAKKMYEEAITAVKKTAFLSDGGSLSNTLLAQAYALSGKRNEAEVVLNMLVENSNKIYTSETMIAIIYIALNMKDKALEWLEKAYLNRNFGLIYLNESPTFDNLRTEPKFQTLIKKMGLSEYQNC